MNEVQEIRRDFNKLMSDYSDYLAWVNNMLLLLSPFSQPSPSKGLIDDSILSEKIIYEQIKLIEEKLNIMDSSNKETK